MDDLKRRFGRLVAAHRKRLGLTQRQLAEAADMSDDMVARVEVAGTGVSFATVEKLARALEVDPAELFTSELPGGAFHRHPLTELTSKLAHLNSEELTWLARIIDAALAPRR